MPSHDEYTVAIFCALSLELAAVRGMMDTEFENSLDGLGTRSYTLGAIGGHNVVAVVLAEVGTTDATAAALQLLNDFGSIRFGLMVGIAGGIPNEQYDIRLGDIVVSMPTDASPGVIQFDKGKRLGDGGFLEIGCLSKPPRLLIDAVNRVRSASCMGNSNLLAHVQHMWDHSPAMREQYSHRGQAQDILFESSYTHVGGTDCATCDRTFVVKRPWRRTETPEIFHGTVGSSNAVIKDSDLRDALKARNILCVEMEAAGLMDTFPSLVIRSICDYADSHKSQAWQPYAAATAAAYAKELLLAIPSKTIENARYAKDIVDMDIVDDFLQPSINTLWKVPPEAAGLDVRIASTYAQMKDECLRKGMDWRHPDDKVMLLNGTDKALQREMCLQFAHQFRRKFWGVFWIEADTAEGLEVAMLQQSRPYLKTKSYREVKAWIENLKQHWLFIVIDNSDPYVNFTDLIPHSSGGLVLVSSRCLWSEATLTSYPLFKPKVGSVTEEATWDVRPYLQKGVLIVSTILVVLLIVGGLTVVYVGFFEKILIPLLDYLF
ncbi:hypothetical protein CAC42_5211 [Sphaceloma murrayae]|uniref:Nucleoside phosphorylase domain-containing protein n=1 Tax=Sphaceloma murrayae TaxID=2082308 RepID=A0A2K1QUE5_9PEZI|nr:hypothetical protein CAC42_5211 [Sphaceloma murrayae]